MPHALASPLIAPGCVANVKPSSLISLTHRCTLELGHEVHISALYCRLRPLKTAKSTGCCRAGDEKRIRQASADYIEGGGLEHASVLSAPRQSPCRSPGSLSRSSATLFACLLACASMKGLCQDLEFIGCFLCAGLREGVDEDDLVAQELGLLDASQMTSVQEKYKERIKAKLQEVTIRI